MAYRIDGNRVLVTLSPGREHPCEADASTFRALGENHGVDAMRAFFEGAPVAEAEVATFVPLGPFHARDARRVYWRTRVIEGASPATFEALGGDHGRDGERIYDCANLVTGVDAASFEVLDDVLTRDRHAVRRFGAPIPGVAPADVEVHGGYVRLGRTWQYRGQALAGDVTDALRVLGPALATDGKHTWVGSERHAGTIDPAWHGLDLDTLQERIATARLLGPVAKGDAAAMLALARRLLERDPLEAVVLARVAPVFGGRRSRTLEADALYLLDPNDELPELAAEISLAVASKLAKGTEVPCRADAAAEHLANALREGLLAPGAHTRERLVDDLGEELVAAAEARVAKPGRRARKT